MQSERWYAATAMIWNERNDHLATTSKCMRYGIAEASNIVPRSHVISEADDFGATGRMLYGKAPLV